MMESIDSFLAFVRNCAILGMLALLIWQGATRWVRRLMVLIVGILLTETVLHYGLFLACQLLIYIIITVTIIITLSILAYRIPVSSQFIQVNKEDYPTYASKRLNRLTQQFTSAGFLEDLDAEMHYYFFRLLTRICARGY